MEEDLSICKKWLLEPKIDPETGENITDINIFTKLAMLTLKTLKPEEIYVLNKDMFDVLGLNDIFETD